MTESPDDHVRMVSLDPQTDESTQVKAIKLDVRDVTGV